MLGKLMKYEWRGYRFPLLVMLLVLFGTTLLTCGVILTINPKYDDVLTGYSVIALVLCIFLYYFGLIGCTMGTLLIILIRFYKTCYTDQGYLTHTLPVTAKQIFNAKAIMAMLMYLIILVGIVATLFLIAGVAITHIADVSSYEASTILNEFLDLWSEQSEEFRKEMGFGFGWYIVLLVIYMLIACATNIIICLGCVSLGQLYAKHRVVGAIAAYFVVQVVEQIAGYLCSLPIYSKIIQADQYGEELTMSGTFSPTMLLTLAVQIILAVAMYFANLHMMTKQLNLE